MDNNGNNKSLYKPSFEHDACGIGAVVSIDNKASHKIVEDALLIVEKLEHRAGKDFAGEIGDGVGIMLHVSHRFFKKTGKKLEVALFRAVTEEERRAMEEEAGKVFGEGILVKTAEE